MSISLSTLFPQTRTISKAKLLYFLSFLAVIALPLSLSVTYATILPALLLTASMVNKVEILAFLHNKTLKPLLIFIAFGALAAIFGLRPLTSWKALLHLLALPGSIIVFSSFLKNIETTRAILLLSTASALASLHSLFESAFPDTVKKLFVGTVTESGQLTLIIPLLVGLTYFLYKNLKLKKELSKKAVAQSILLALCNFAVFLVLGFSHELSLPRSLKYALAIIALTLTAYSFIQVWQILKSFSEKQKDFFILLFSYIGPLLTSALIVNLKRGPWLGVTIALLIFAFIYYRKSILPIIIITLLLAFTVNPISQRLEQSSRDFFISGGRSTIWDVGVELITKYPLGIGFDNSSFLREFAPQVPPELVHFHSNFLNILVEFGWLGLGIFIWWLYELLKLCFSKISNSETSPLLPAIGCSLIAWQVAGLVEYNFGDSEVLFVVSLLIALVQERRCEQTANGVGKVCVAIPCSIGKSVAD